MTMDFKIGALLGRLSNGFQSDHGTRYHAVTRREAVEAATHRANKTNKTNTRNLRRIK